MATSTKKGLTLADLDINGVQVTVSVKVGDYSKYVAISPLNYEIFKKWDKIYAPRVVRSIVREIEHELAKK